MNVIVPRRYDADLVKRFLYQKRHWIFDKLEESRLYRSRLDVQNVDTITYLGKPLKLIESHNKQQYAQVSLTPDRIIVRLGLNGEVGKILNTWYRQKTKDLVFEKVALFSKRIGARYNSLTIRNARTRWGSCSRLGNLNFNWKLIILPEPVIDYVIIHELCHLKELNHSPTFWKLVEKYCPDYYEHRKWLKEHEAEVSRLTF